MLLHTREREGRVSKTRLLRRQKLLRSITQVERLARAEGRPRFLLRQEEKEGNVVNNSVSSSVVHKNDKFRARCHRQY